MYATHILFLSEPMGLCLCLMLLTPPPTCIVPGQLLGIQPILALNRNEQPIHIGGVYSALGTKTYVALEKRLSVSISKIETYAVKELCSSCAISPQISLLRLTSWTNTVELNTKIIHQCQQLVGYTIHRA